MTECPELGALETSPLPAELRDHVSSCDSCRLVVEVFDAAAGRLDTGDCLRFDALLAARADGTLGRAGTNLLERHLASCASCREVAHTLSPTQDADGDHAALPEVDPASYALGLEVARGGMGRILAARDLRVGRPIAIKELLGRAPQLAARFEREARVTARLQHPGIVPIYEIGKWPDGTPFYSMRMVDGRTLADAIDSAQTLNARLALLPAVIAATEAVAFAHAKRVIHRDLTPSNILVGAYGETVVIDWGLAKDLLAELPNDDVDDLGDLGPENSSDRLTGVGAVIGTATYMPPEQAHAIPVDERADVYALGAILYHVLAGAPPYRAKTAKELLRAVKTAPPPPIDRVQPGTPRDLVSIITKAMARDPDARYPSARELAEELKRFQTGRLVEAHAYSRLELVKRFVRRHRAAVTVSALALAISASLGTVAVINILRSRAEARATVRELILEKGRIELLAGNTQRALAYLHEAHQRGADGPMLQFLLGSAMRGLSNSEHTLDCGGSVRTIAFDAGARLVAAGCTDVAKVWRLVDGKELAQVETGDAGYGGVRFAPDGTRFATWGESGVARVWSTETGELLATLDHGSASRVEINRLSFTPDGARVATTGSDGIAIIWDLHAQAPIRTIVGSTAPMRAMRSLYGWLSSDGKALYTMTPTGVGNGWDVATGESLGMREHGSITIGGDLSADGRLGLSCGVDGRIRTWDLQAGTQLHQFEGHTEPVWKCVFSSDSRLVLSGGHDGRANIYDVATGRSITAVHHGDIIVNADFSPDTRRFATVGIGGRVKLWDTRTGALLANFDSVRGKDARFAPDNEHLAVARGDGRLQIWRFDPPAVLAAPGTAQIGHGGTLAVFSAAVSGALEIRELDTRRVIAANHGLVEPFAIADAAPIVAGAAGAGVRVIDVAGAMPPRELAVGAVDALRLSANGTRLVVERAGEPPAAWDVATGTRLVTFAGAAHALLSADGRRAIAWTPEQRPVIWDVDARRPGATLATAGRYTPIGLASGSRAVLLETTGERRVSLWDAGTGARIAERRDASIAPRFDPTRRWLTTIDDADHSVTVWSTADGAAHASFLGDNVTQAMVNPQGTFVAAIAEYGTVALLMSATDGRILARWPLEHPAPQIDEAAGFKPPAGDVMWTRDGKSVISRSSAIAIWPVVNRFTRQEIAEGVKRHVPWRVDNGQLVWIRNGKLRGSVVRDGVPQANLKILVEIRTPPSIGSDPINWESSKNKVSTRNITTDTAGTFALDGLLHGQYTLTIGDARFTAYVSAEDDPIRIELP